MEPRERKCMIYIYIYIYIYIWQVFVDDSPVGLSESSRFVLAGPPLGRHSLGVVLLDRDGAEVSHIYIYIYI